MSSPSLLENISKQWQEFDLEGKRNELDNQASSITELRKDGITSRNQLALTTREFKKMTNTEKLKSLGSLLKTYQQEIDRLTQRSKGAESAFLGLYSELQPLSDPCIAFKSAIEDIKKISSIGKLELENKNLKSQIEEFQHEFKDIKNQEVTVRRLEDKIKEYEVKLDKMVNEKIEETSNNIRDEHILTINQQKEREENLLHQLEQTKNELARCVTQNEENQNKIMNEKEFYEEKLEAKQDELEYVADEINRVTAENERLKRDLGRVKKDMELMSNKHANNKEQQFIHQLESKISQRELELSESQTRFELLQNEFSKLSENKESAISQLESKLNDEKHKIVQLQNQLEERPTAEQYIKLKEKIKVLKGIEGIQSTYDITSSTSVENLLQQKNKNLETQLIQHKETLLEKTNEIDTLKIKFNNLTEKSQQQIIQIEKLEKDLIEGYSNQISLSNSSDDIPNNLNSSIPRSESILKVVCTQRDRLSSKLQLLEDKKEDDQKQLQALNVELDSLRSDNVKLYQKIQYLESYNSSNRSTNRDLESNVEQRYKKKYEESVNPFVEFNRKERFSRYNQLSTAEKLTLTMGDFFLSNKFSRLFILIYSVVLHIFIFILMYKFAQIPTTIVCDDFKSS